ncbi:competence/damage-inducible protein A [Pseudofulvibacter geojedonensis]|uniref:CinA-like protein n=1 Tax=Pseudofulvibacter geojedonensis TaxID=1123758 RepID=A0ABW3HZP2_9FLAO
MKAEIITIGDELLIGQVVDTNSAFIGQELNKIGVSVYQITSIQDDKQHILEALSEAEKRVDIVIITGGLGPTKDDITKQTFCEYFNDELVENKEILAHIERLFKTTLKKPLLESNILQAKVPSKAEILHNTYGTAPGMYMKKRQKVFASLPGVPFEMKALLKDKVIPRIISEFRTPFIKHKTIITEGLGESTVAERLVHFENELPKHIKLAYLPNLNVLRLRLSGTSFNERELNIDLETLSNQLISLLEDIVIGFDDDTPELLVTNLLLEKKQTISLAESCTGGLIASTITKIPGVSAIFKGSMVTYQTPTKSYVLGVDENIIKEHSVVSTQVAKDMALKVQSNFKSDYSIATTGNAGPSKGDSDAEVGTVFIAVASPNGVVVSEFNFGNNRYKVMHKAKNKALEMLRKEILAYNK